MSQSPANSLTNYVLDPPELDPLPPLPLLGAAGAAGAGVAVAGAAGALDEESLDKEELALELPFLLLLPE